MSFNLQLLTNILEYQCTPVSISNGILTLAFNQQSHITILSDPATKQITESALSQYFDYPLTINCILKSDWEKSQKR